MINYSSGELFISREYDVAASQVWDIITDTELWPVWGPSLTSVTCSHRCITAGSSGRVRTIAGIWLPFTITTFRHMEFWGWRIGRFHATGHQVTSLGPHRCRLAFLMPWWAAFYLPVCAVALQRIQKLTREDGISSTPSR